MWGDIIIAFTLAFITAFMLTPLTIKLARKLGAIDTPKDYRRVNKIAMPRLGGLAVIAGFTLSVFYLLFVMSIEGNIDLAVDSYDKKLLGFFAGAVIIGITCFIDDVKGIRAIVKLLAQIVAAMVCIKTGIVIDDIKIGVLENLKIPLAVSEIITVFWIVGITNALNLIDGLDGLSTGITLISSGSLLLVFSLNGSPLVSIVLITALAGALTGFLPYNFNPAKTFIGDTGSNFLGYCLAIISILGIAKTYTAIVIIAPIIVLALPLFDTFMAVVRRVIKGKSLKAIMTPDSNHLHHRMIRKGFTQKQAVLTLYFITATLGMFTVILMESGPFKAFSFILLIVIVIAAGYKEFFKQRLLTTEEDNYDKEEYQYSEDMEEHIRHDKDPMFGKNDKGPKKEKPKNANGKKKKVNKK